MSYETPADLLIGALRIFGHNPREKPAGKYRRQWECTCPAHDDRSPSFGIAEANDGRLLIHCLAGCEPQAIVDSLDLKLSDLFPPEDDDYKPFWRNKNPRQEPSEDDYFVAIAEDHKRQGRRLSEQEKQRVLKAKLRERRPK